MSEPKIITVTSPLLPNLEEYNAMLQDIWSRKWITNNGHYHQQLEKALAEYLGVEYISLFTNGTLPLITALQALGITEGEVITTPYSFVATSHSIWWNKLKPVFVDVLPENGNIDPSKIEAAITDKTVAILPVHVYGNLCDHAAIDAIAKKHGLKVLYDAAHAFGVTENGVSAANFGDASIFSFHTTKVFNTIEGGAVCYGDSALVQKFNDLKNFGIHSAEEVPFVGGNAKMNEFCAAMGLCNLRHLDAEIEKRRRVVERYNERLSGVPGIKLNAPQKGVKSNYAYYPVVFDGYKYDRDKIFAMLGEQNIVARKYFYPLTNSFECYRKLLGSDPAETPVAQHIAANVLCLPLYADLSLEDVDRICDVILN